MKIYFGLWPFKKGFNYENIFLENLHIKKAGNNEIDLFYLYVHRIGTNGDVLRNTSDMNQKVKSVGS